jgi:hypothetical protein
MGENAGLVLSGVFVGVRIGRCVVSQADGAEVPLAKTHRQTLRFATMQALLASLCSIDHVTAEQDLELAKR